MRFEDVVVMMMIHKTWSTKLESSAAGRRGTKRKNSCSLPIKKNISKKEFQFVRIRFLLVLSLEVLHG